MDTTPAHTVHAAQPSPPAESDALIEAYAPVVKYAAQRLACRLPAWVCLDDLISSGVVGLIDAIAKYDPTRGTTFKTYAEWRIRGAMLDALRELDWAPRTVRQKEHALTQAYADLERQHGRSVADEEVAAVLGINLNTFNDWLTDVRGVSDVSLERPLEREPNGQSNEHIEQEIFEARFKAPNRQKRDIPPHLLEKRLEGC